MNSHFRHWIGLTALLAVSVFSMNTYHLLGANLASVMNTPEHAAFDGTVMPIQDVPDWTNLTGEEYKMNFHDLPANKFLDEVPVYDNEYFTFSSGSLVWGNAQHNLIRNAKITYPVPYAGNYRLDDSGEHAGSHPAVDIKVLKDTPIHNVANGVVYESGNSSSWGYYIVIKHNEVPNPSSPSQNTTIFMSYSHLSGPAFVKKGDVVTKNQIIGAVGATGTATTNHVHFQADTSLAPWHPYWPFTGTEASNAGLGFFDAVNAGLGIDNVNKYTFNPMDFVQDNLGATPVFEPVVVVPEPVVVVPEPVVVVPEPVVEPVVIPVEDPEPDFVDVVVESPDFIMIGDQRQVLVSLIDINGEMIKNFNGEITLNVSDSALAQLDKTKLVASDFGDGEASLMLYAERQGDVTLSFTFEDQLFTSNLVRLISNIEPFAGLGIQHDGTFTPHQPEDIQIVSLDLEGRPTPAFRGDGPVELSLVKGSGAFSKKILKKEDFYGGVAHVDFTSDSMDEVVIRVTYGKIVEESKSLDVQVFTDLSESDSSFEAIFYLYRAGVITGYPDGTFRADNLVNRVEALKLVFNTLDVDLDDLDPIFPDTQTGEWYSNYLGTAVGLGVAKGYPDGTFKPLQTVNKVELLKMILVMADEYIDPVISERPYSDVDTLSWYAPYVQFAKDYSLFPISGDEFEPGTAMTRREVAEVLYRYLTH